MEVIPIPQAYSPNGSLALKMEQEQCLRVVFRRSCWLFLIVIVSLSIVRNSFGSSVLSSLVEEAYQNNQDLLSMTENAQALRAEAPFFGSLQDPVVGIGLLNLPVDTFEFDQEPMTQKQLFASQ